MSYSKRSRYSRSPSPYDQYRASVSRSLSRSRSILRNRSRSYDSTDVDNPGNNLYVTGLSPRITKRDLEKHFSSEGTVEDVHLVVDPRTRESRGFGFVTMSSVKEAERCIKYLDRSVLEGQAIMVEKARRRRGRTPTPGRYLGLRTVRVRRRSSSSSPYGSRSPSYSSLRDRSWSRGQSYSPYYRHRRSYSRTPSPHSRSLIRHDRSYSPYYRDYSPDDRRYSRSRSRRYYSPDDRYYRRARSYHSVSRSISPRRRYSRRSYSRSLSPPRYMRRYSRSVTPRRSRRSYSRSVTPRPRSRRSYSISFSPRSRRSYSRSVSPRSRTGRRYYSRSRSVGASSRSVSVSSRSTSPSASL